ncbi:MAG: Uma2 family endonuclease [Polyangiaceae bacterium]
MFFAGRRPARRGVVSIPPDIAVEVVSPSARDQRRDRADKRAEYTAFGVRWLWLVDPEAREVEILERDGDGYAARSQATGGVVDVPGCEGLVIDLEALWRKTDELEG